MKCECHSGPLCNRDNAFHEPTVVLPQCTRADLYMIDQVCAAYPRVAQSLVTACNEHFAASVRVLSNGKVKPVDQRVSTTGLPHPSTPDGTGHEVVAKHGNASTADVCDRRADVLNLCLAPRTSDHAMFEKLVRKVFDCFQSEAGRLNLLTKCLQVGNLPPVFARQVRCIQLDAPHPQLLCVCNRVGSNARQLPYGDSHLQR